jgi:hypothetical protein
MASLHHAGRWLALHGFEDSIQPDASAVLALPLPHALP